MKNKKRILIIGGLGFIGKNLYRKCKQLDHSVSILSDVSVDDADPFSKEVDREDIIIGDINDPNSLAIIRDYSVAYLLAGLSGAATSIHDPYNDVKTNLIGPLNILEACRSLNPNVVILFPSSRLVYGKPQYNPVDEKHPLDPESIYAIHKLTAEYYCELYHRIYNIRTIVFRISNPYGPYQLAGGKKYGILNWFIYNALKGNEIEIYGHGAQQRDYIYIDDLTELMISSVDNPALFGGIFNIGSGHGISIHDAIQTLKTIIPDLKYKYVTWPEIEGKIETGDYISDIQKIVALTGWSPKVSFKDGMASTVEYYREHFK